MPRRASPALIALATGALLPLTALPTQAAPTGSSPDRSDTRAQQADNRLHPLAVRDTTIRQNAVDDLATGDARLVGKGRDRTIRMSDGTEVDYPVNQTAQLLTFLVEFGADGPLHNQIAKPPASDNANYWKADFNRGHYQDMFFDGLADQGGESFRDLYHEMSSGRFQLEGDVSDWVRISRPESHFGANVDNGQESPERMAEYLQDTADAWYAGASTARSDADIKSYLAQFDTWDRYDADGDGDFNEPDGYIDHFQAIHAGEGEEAGAPDWTIWSHRSGASWWTDSGPDTSLCQACTHQGGVEIGDSGYYILDYTTEPENGGLGVFAHEFGHDLGLPDYYDTSSAYPDNGTGFWNLMSSGSWLSHRGAASGTTPSHMGATEKYFLGWYGPDDLATVDGLAAEPQTVTLGPSNHATTKGKQAVLVTLPDGHRTESGPMTGSPDAAYLYSGSRDRWYAASTSPPVDVPDGAAELHARVAYQIEPDFDYAFLRVSTDGGDTWTDVATSESADPAAGGLGLGITGVSGTDVPDGTDFRSVPVSWVDLTADLSAYAGQSVQLRWEYLTDGRTHGWGLAVDDLSIGGYSTAFGADHGWSSSGFNTVVDGTYGVDFPQYYLAENRQYRGYDSTLRTGPYSANDPTRPNRLDHFAYQDGLLVWYANGYYSDNNTSEHPGGGANLPVDSTPGNQVWRTRWGSGSVLAEGRLQTFDSTFDVDRTDPLAMSSGSLRLSVPSRRSVPVFEDTDPDAYLDDSRGDEGLALSTAVAGAGTEIQVVSSDESTGTMTLKIGKRFVAATSGVGVLGSARVGGTLVAFGPTWFQPGVRSTIAWLRDGVAIPGADRSYYRVTTADAGHDISVAVTGSRSGYTSTSVTSRSATVPRTPPTPTKGVSVTGTAQVGATLTAVGATWPVTGSSTFVWSVGHRVVGRGTSYVATSADLGKRVTLTETFTAAGHLPATSSAQSAVIARSAKRHR